MAVLFVSMGCLISCHQKEDNDVDVEAMRARLNAIMLEHQQMQSDYENYASTLSAKEDSIQAQAREIESLLAQLKSAQANNGGRSVGGNNSAALRKKNAELKAKQEQIAEMEGRLAQMSKELESIKQLVRQNGGSSQSMNDQDLVTLGEMQRELDNQDRLIAKLANEKVVLTNRNDSLTALVAFFSAQPNPTTVQVVEGDATAQVANLQAQVVGLQSQVSQQQEEINRLNAELKEQVALVAEAQSMAASAKSEADASKKATAKTKGAVNQKLAELEAMCENYRREIEQLRAENQLLRTENDSLRGQVVTMQKEAEQTAQDNEKLSQKVRMAAILVTRDVTVTPLKRISSNSGKETNRASAVNALKIDGTILDNNVVDPGTVVIYARVCYPNGQVLCIPPFDANGNAIPCQEIEVNGTKITYTFAHALEFTGESRPFSMIWNRGEEIELTAGIYKVTLYANGNNIGTTTFRLK